jgi:hypothetical protein
MYKMRDFFVTKNYIFSTSRIFKIIYLHRDLVLLCPRKCYNILYVSLMGNMWIALDMHKSEFHI